MGQTTTPKRREVCGPGYIASLYRVGPKTVSRWADTGAISVGFVTPGGHRRFWKDEIDKQFQDSANRWRKPADQ